MTALLSIALKGLVLLLAAALGARVLRASSASARHGVWAVAFAALVLLPVLEWAGPRWPLGVLPAIEAPLGVAVAPPIPPTPPPPPAPPAVEAAHAWHDRDRTAFESQMEAFDLNMDAFDHDLEAFDRQQTLGVDGVTAWTSFSLTRVTRRASGWLLGLWAAGALVVGLGWLAAVLAARRIVAEARPETDDEWAVTAERARRLVGLAAPVRLLRSDALDVPIAWGWGGGAVVLPADADAWDEERREAVLLHEMAHLARRDAWSQAVAQVALAIHWANPLAWWGYRRFLDAREQACDDAVIRGGARPSAYAAHLVGVARAVRRDRLALAAVAPMARTAPIEHRVISILDADRVRERFGGRALACTTAVCVAVLIPLAAFQPVAQTLPAPISSPDWTAVADTLDRLYPAEETWAEMEDARAEAEDALAEAEDARAEAEEARADAAEHAWDLAHDSWQDAMDAAADDIDRAAFDVDDVAADAGEVEAALDAADDGIDEARRQIRRTIADLKRQGGPRAGLRIYALRQAEAGLAQIDRQAIRAEAQRAQAEAQRALQHLGLDARQRPAEKASAPEPPVPPVPPAVDWKEVERSRRAALRHPLNRDR